MPARTKARTRMPGQPLKSPLAVASSQLPSGLPPGAPGARPAPKTALSEREATTAEFEDYLRTTTNRDDRPYEEATINAYVSPAKHLDRWMTRTEITGDFTAAGTALLNRYFREYYREHGQ